MREPNTKMKKQGAPVGILLGLGLIIVLASSVAASAQASGLPSIPPSAVVARVNEVAVNESEVQDETEALYPSNSARGHSG